MSRHNKEKPIGAQKAGAVYGSFAEEADFGA